MFHTELMNTLYTVDEYVLRSHRYGDVKLEEEVPPCC